MDEKMLENFKKEILRSNHAHKDFFIELSEDKWNVGITQDYEHFIWFHHGKIPVVIEALQRIYNIYADKE